MYAIIQTGSKQYRVKEGDIIDIELISESDDKTVKFDKVFFVNDGETSMVGTPTVSNYTVKGELVGEIKGPKVIAYKFKRRKNYKRKIGHRQNYSRVRITEISAAS
jgi:large subunit ribosomal protein L21